MNKNAMAFLVKVMLIKVISMDFNFDRRTKNFVVQLLSIGKLITECTLYIIFYLDILKVINTLQLVYGFG